MTDSPINKINFSGQIHLHSGWADVEDTCYELMQYTGLKDKNGKEIYEGDILHLELGSFAEYADEQEMFIVGKNNIHDECCYLKNAIIQYDGVSCEVVGNIYENPELLEQGQE